MRAGHLDRDKHVSGTLLLMLSGESKLFSMAIRTFHSQVSMIAKFDVPAKSQIIARIIAVRVVIFH